MTTRRRRKLELSRGTLAAIWILLSGASCSRPRIDDGPPRVIPFTAPELRPAPGNANDDAAASKLIEALVEIAKPDYGFSPTLRGEAFPPVPGSERDYAWIYTDHGLDRSTAVLGLVELGPRAIPSLLEHIDDGRPTLLEVKAPRWGGSVDHACELPINPAIAAERAALEEAGISMFPDRRSAFLAASVEHHVVTVGDVCFARRRHLPPVGGRSIPPRGLQRRRPRQHLRHHLDPERSLLGRRGDPLRRRRGRQRQRGHRHLRCRLPRRLPLHGNQATAAVPRAGRLRAGPQRG